MNPILANIHNRRSVRRFDPRPIDREILETLLEAGNQAPSGSNAQPWRFAVVTGEASLRLLRERARPRYLQWLAGMPEKFQELRRGIDAQLDDPVYYGAPVVIFVIGKGGASAFDCPMVSQNIMLAARSLGLGSCWVYIGSLVIADPEIKTLIGLEEGEAVYGPLVLGYPQAAFPDPPAKKAPSVRWL